MPLVVPGLMSTGKKPSNAEEWSGQLAGKKLGEKHDEMTFAKTDLPKEHRVLKGNDMMTMDYKPERVNVHVNDDGIVHKVTMG